MEMPEKLPHMENIKTLLRMKYYKHSYDALKDIHDLAANYLSNINIILNFNENTDELKFEAEKRETIYYSVMELLNKFESSVTNGGEVRTEDITETSIYLYYLFNQLFSQFNIHLITG